MLALTPIQSEQRRSTRLSEGFERLCLCIQRGHVTSADDRVLKAFVEAVREDVEELINLSLEWNPHGTLLLLSKGFSTTVDEKAHGLHDACVNLICVLAQDPRWLAAMFTVRVRLVPFFYSCLSSSSLCVDEIVPFLNQLSYGLEIPETFVTTTLASTLANMITSTERPRTDILQLLATTCRYESFRTALRSVPNLSRMLRRLIQILSEKVWPKLSASLAEQ
ncbi:hypothetical protein BC832DRAFT_17898 [Gaertneriomyces semiglobifer]|nr:hypothetical protein BC832DRAFT_17898 [Gaertneriomyces semiglobifer]